MIEKGLSYKTDISKAKGLGSAHSGLHHWIFMRFTAVLNIIMLVWMIYIIYNISNMDVSEAIEFIGLPLNVTAISLFVISLFHHSANGMQIVIEDYVHCRVLRLLMMLFIKILTIITVASTIISLIYLMKI